MTIYYLQVLNSDISICLDSQRGLFYHSFEVGDIITIHMYSADKGTKVKLCGVEYDANFQYYDLLISSGFLVDISKSIERDKKLKQLGI
jgi:hypothetical protein